MNHDSAVVVVFHPPFFFFLFVFFFFFFLFTVDTALNYYSCTPDKEIRGFSLG